ncbi:MAG: hypothetical protein J6K39_00205 [Clostridia bacterium]|nr:hypothetical protein [Clostridia bacterium]
MEELIKQFEELCSEDDSNLSKKERLARCQATINDIDTLMNNEKINLDTYERLLEIKKSLMMKKFLLQGEEE